MTGRTGLWALWQMEISGTSAFWRTGHWSSCGRAGTWKNGLRHKRILAHRALEQLRQSRHMEKWEVYIWLQAKLGLDERQAHIGQFSEWMCDEVVRLCRQASAPPAAGQAAA